VLRERIELSASPLPRARARRNIELILWARDPSRGLLCATDRTKTPRLPQEVDLAGITSLCWSFVPFHVVRAAFQSGLFDKLAQHGEMNSRQLADRQGWQLRPMERLLDILEYLGLIYRSGNSVGATEAARPWLVRARPSCIGDYFERAALLEAAYHQLELHLSNDRPDLALESATRKSFGLSADATVQDVLRFGNVLNATSIPVAEAFFRLVDRHS